MLYLISALIFLLVYVVTIAILRSRVAVSDERIDDYLLSSEQAAQRLLADQSFTERVLLPNFKRLGELIMSATPAGFVQKSRQKLDMAGNPPHFGLVEYFGAKALSIAVLIPAGIFCLQFTPLVGLLRLLVIAVIAGVGLWLPDIVLQRVIEARQVAIRRALPDMLDLLVISVEAGVSFDGAVQKVVEKATGPLAMELRRVLEQVQLGQTRGDALREMAQRTLVPDLVSFVAAVTQAETMGISIATVLRTQAVTVRERRSQFAREMAAKLPTKLLFPLVFLIFPSLFAVILGPAVIRILEVFQQMNK